MAGTSETKKPCHSQQTLKKVKTAEK